MSHDGFDNVKSWYIGALKKIREEADYTIRTGGSASDFLEKVDEILDFAGFPSSE